MDKFLTEYPRPDLEREHFLMLHGEWDFSASSDGSENYDMKIIVPFPPESRMSGVGRLTMPEDTIRYRRFLDIEKEEGKRYILSFIAVDYESTVLVNGRSACHHTGGSLPFSCDITELLKTGTNEIKVIVTDPTDTMEIPRGKQSLHPHQIWYGPVSGIWQPVWLDIVPERYITRMMVTPRLETSELEFLIAANTPDMEPAVLSIDGREVNIKVNAPFRVKLEETHLWSPEDPYLYYFSVTYEGETVKGYTAMRSFGVGTDSDGNKRLLLNGKPYFHHGVLDQGWWEESLMTPPSDEAMVRDISLMKEMGFNTIRKHIKVESPRWYWHASRLGMLVWQDAVSGGIGQTLFGVTAPLFIGSFLKDTKLHKCLGRTNREEASRWEDMLIETVLHLYSVPAIAMWVIFNEGWGQFDSTRIREKLLSVDSTRTIDTVSGWHDQGDGDFLSRHVYFKPYKFRQDKHGRCVLLSEFGGYGLDLSEKKEKKGMFSYKKIRTKEELTDEIAALYEREVIPAMKNGLSASIYTQLSDVESERNGLITYDRKTVKADPAEMRKIAENLKL